MNDKIPEEQSEETGRFNSVDFPIIRGAMDKMFNLEPVIETPNPTTLPSEETSWEIGPGSERFKTWQKWREEVAFPRYRNDIRKKLTLQFPGLCAELGYVESLDFKISKDVFPEEFAMLQNLKTSIRNKLFDKNNPLDAVPVYGNFTDSGAKPKE